MCIHDDRLALMTSVSRQILVWDWKTGKQIAEIASLVLSRDSDLLTMYHYPSRATIKFYGFSFLDRSSILFPYRTSGQEQMLRLQVVTFDSESQTPLTKQPYVFTTSTLTFSAPTLSRTYFLSSNTLPSNTSNSCFPGFFHSEPSSRLLALEVEMFNTDFILEGNIPLHVLYVPHDVLLGYIRSHPSDADTVVVPWKEWGPGNAHILTLTPADPRQNLLAPR
jgi:hypothetical protein